MACADGTADWVSVSQLIAPGSAPPLRAPPLQGTVGGGNWESASYVGPILVTIFCCLIGGIIALVYTGQANSKAAAGDIAGANRDKSTARLWVIISLFSSIGVLILYALVVIFARVVGGP